jgi:hypothetical protein
MSEELKGIEAMINSPMFKIAIGATITTLVGWALLAMKNTNNKIKNSISKDDLDKATKEAKEYTDSRIIDHEKLHKSIEGNFKDIREDNVRIESKVDKILFLLAKG